MSRQTLVRALLVASALALALPSTHASAQSLYATEMNHGREAFDGSNFALAQRHFQAAHDAANTDGQRATALYSLAVVLQRQGRLDEAKERASKAVELWPKHSQARAMIEELNNAANRPQPKTAGKAAAPAAASASGQSTDLAKIEEEERAAIRRAREKGVDLAGVPLNQKAPAATPKPPAREAAPAKEAKETREPREAKETRPTAPPKEAVVAAKNEPAAPKAKEPAAKTEPPGPVVAAIVKKKPETPPAAPAPKPVASAPAAAAAAAAPVAAAAPAAPAIDYSKLGQLEPSGARLVASSPGIAAPLLGAGFTNGDKSIALVTGPAKAADGTENAIELRQIDIQSGKVGDVYALHADMAAALGVVAASSSQVVTAVPAGKKSKSVSIHTWNPATVANDDAIELEGSGKDLPLALDALVASRNGARIAAVHSTGVQIFNTKGLKGSGSYRFAARADLSAPVAAAMSGNGQRVVLTNGARFRLIDKAGVKDVGFSSAAAAVDVVALSENGDLIAAAAGQSLRLVDANTGKDLDPLPVTAQPMTAIAFGPDGARLAVASQDRVHIWTLNGRKVLAELTTSGAPTRIAFSGDGRLLLASGPSGTRVWLVDPLAPAPSASTPVAAAPSAPPVVPKVAAAVEPKAEAPTAREQQPASSTVTAAATPPPAAPAPASVPTPAPVEQQTAAVVPASPPTASDATATAASAPPVMAMTTSAPPASAAAGIPPQPVAQPVVEAPKLDARQIAQLKSQRNRAFTDMDCDRVKTLDEQIGGEPRYNGCVAKVEQTERARILAKLATDRIAALSTGDCDRVQQLDAEIGTGAVHAQCVQRAEDAKRTAERNQLVADRQAAFDKQDCNAVMELDGKIGSGALFQSCTVEKLIKTGTARELYLAAAKSDADKQVAEARRYYRAIVDQHPQDDLAIKAAERMTVLSDIEAQERNAQMATGSTRERARPRRKQQRH